MLVKVGRVTKQRWVLGIALCLLVFVFSFHAKTGVYGGAGGGKVSPVTASKLWLNGQKLQVKPAVSPTLIFLVAFVLLSFFGLRREFFVSNDSRLVVARQLGLQDLHRSLRPPPLH